MTATLTLHEYALAGNCYKIRLTAAHLGLTLERREYDIMKGETRTPEFMATVNSNGRIPVLQIGDKFLPESNAACWYLAEGTALLPDDRFDRADVLRWMCWEQYNHEPNIATMRFWKAFLGLGRLNDMQKGQLETKWMAGEAALCLMDDHLKRHDWFVGDGLTLADICLYAYTHVAGEGGFMLSRYPAVEAWLARVAAAPRHVTIDA